MSEISISDAASVGRAFKHAGLELQIKCRVYATFTRKGNGNGNGTWTILRH